jgi:hypothetical protein
MSLRRPNRCFRPCGSSFSPACQRPCLPTAPPKATPMLRHSPFGVDARTSRPGPPDIARAACASVLVRSFTSPPPTCQSISPTRWRSRFSPGNTSIVRLPSRQDEQIDLVVRALREVLAESRFATLDSAIHLLRYEHDDRITEFWLQNTLGRIIWGGDATVAHMRGLRAHPRSREIAFPDRYSFCVVNAAAILAADANALSDLYLRFANDLYLMDQHACSSPHLVAWIGDSRRYRRCKAVVLARLRVAGEVKIRTGTDTGYGQVCRHLPGDHRFGHCRCRRLAASGAHAHPPDAP